MSQYGIFQALYMSFYSKRLYQDVAVNWGGKAFLYLLLLTVLSWIFSTIFLQTMLNKAFTAHGEEFFAQIPVLTIKDGVLHTPEDKPYMIKNPIDKKDLILIDTTGKTTSLEQTDAMILVTQTGVLTEKQPNEYRTDVFPKNLNKTIDPQQVKASVAHYLGYAWIPIFLGSVILFYIAYVLSSLIYGLLGKILSAILKVPLTYGQNIQIAMVAMTPAVVLSTILFVFVMAPSFFVSFVLTVIFLIFGITANKMKPV